MVLSHFRQDHQHKLQENNNEETERDYVESH